MSQKILNALAACGLFTGFAVADTVLFYDSISGGAALGRIDTETEAAFVSASSATTSLGSNTTFVQEHSGNQTFTVTLGTGVDMQFRFGGDAETLSGPLADAAETTGEWIGLNFTASQDLTIDSFSFDLYVNSQNGSNYSARDAGLFLRIGNSGPFTLFGTAWDGTNTGDQGTVTFTDTFDVPGGQDVQFRLAFTDRTVTGGGAQQEATRLGSFNISAVSTPDPAYYFDTNGATAGFGSASGSYASDGAYWSTSSAGTAAPDVWANGRKLNFGAVGTTGIAGDTFTVDFSGTAGNSSIAGLNVNQPATVTLAGDVGKNVFLAQDQTWNIVTGSTLNVDFLWDSNGTIPGGLNHGDHEVTLTGGGTINFNGAVLMNGKDGHLAQDDPDLTVNLAASAVWDATPLQGNYILNAGELNFATVASAEAFAKMDAGKSLTINGGTIDNTSGSARTLDLGSGRTILGADFTFTGTDDLDLGNRSVSLGGATRKLTVSANTFGIGGVITDGGLTKDGAGTLLLRGNNTYEGPTTVTAGTLRLAASQLPVGLEVLPLGDSITYGFGGAEDQSGYRRYLHDHLDPVMPDFDYVGVKIGRAGVLPTSPIDQRQHLGMSSYALDDISNNMDGVDNTKFIAIGGEQRDPEGGYWLDGGNGTGRDPLNPDIILMMLGTNDMNDFPGVQGRLNALLTKLTTARPDTRIIVANIVPRTNATLNADSIAYNLMVDEEIALFRQNGKHVSGIDLHTDFPAGALVDGTHPTTPGYQWMAGQWNLAVNAVAREFPDNNTEFVSHALVHSSGVSVASGATLDLDGNDASVMALDVSGNLLLDGGSLTVDSDLLLAGTSTLSMSLGASSDSIGVGGNLTLDGIVNLADAGGFADGIYPLVSYSGTLTDNGLAIGSTPSANYSYAIDTSISGEIRLVVSTPFQVWQGEEFGGDAGNPLIAGPTADPDKDGRSNLVEYFQGSDPNNGGNVGLLAVTGFAGADSVVQYERAANTPDASGALQWSTDLSAWHASGESDGTRTISISESVLNPGGDPEVVEATAQTTAGPVSDTLFFRLQVDMGE